ncbi:6-phospho-beta-glucosidase [Gephyromycinifex aptenodytis]|uniref:6-phospho-beta-glucosidase n=1 Tax=Gephyromycinifex aptenodytis TaxID=2716227 RepID=UPI0014477CC8|nr:6-phospho-beta-glucosidase [Gephyromycinifex aptenodytis]
MKLAILGGGGFRVPLVYGALLRETNSRRVDEVALYDTDEARLASIAAVLTQMGQEPSASAQAGLAPPSVQCTSDLDEAVRDADFIFSAIRVGGLRARTCDERVALDLGLLGQETTGPGGIAYGLRTIPVVLQIASRVAALAPQAWFINFTNPAGMITQAMRSVLGSRVVGICDSPIALGRRAAHALGVDPERAAYDYAGLNHLGWLQGLRVDGVDRLPELIADRDALTRIEEGRLFGADWIADIGALPNEYLYYYDFTREALAGIRGSAQTRGEFLLEQQSAFYAQVAADPDSALSIWRRTRAERDATYMKEARAQGEERDAEDVAGGGYEAVALAIMAAISRGEPATMILNVANGSTLPGLPSDAVIEVACLVDGSGVRPLTPTPLRGRMLGLVQQVKHVEECTIRAASTRCAREAIAAFAQHPLVDSVGSARVLFEGYRNQIPELREVFGAG